MRVDTVKTNVYKFEELSEEAKETAMEELFNINVEDTDWAEFIIEDLVEDCKKLGIRFDSDNVCWSICSRDNHCYVRTCDLNFDWCNYVELPGKFGAYQNYMGGGIVGGIQTEIIPEDKIEEGDEENIPLENLKNDGYGDPGEIAQNLNKALNCFSETLKKLWKEYQYLTNEKCIIETIEANDWEFTIDGKRY